MTVPPEPVRANRLPVGPDEAAMFAGMAEPLRAAVDRLYMLDGIAYEEPAPTFRAAPEPRAG